MIDNDWDADALEYVVTKNSKVTPSKHLLSLYPSVLWISRIDQMKQISNSVKSIVIQGEVGRNEKESFTLSDFPSLISIEIGYKAFNDCHSIVFESMNDWMNDEWDLTQLQSITLGYDTLRGDDNTIISNELIMKSRNDNDDWLIRSSFSVFIQRIFGILFYRQSGIGSWWMMIEYELDIPSLSKDRIQIGSAAFRNVSLLICSSKIGWLIMIEMLILLNML